MGPFRAQADEYFYTTHMCAQISTISLIKTFFFVCVFFFSLLVGLWITRELLRALRSRRLLAEQWLSNGLSKLLALRLGIEGASGLEGLLGR
jgi:hypothetical protein